MTTTEGFNVGDILSSIWGFEQTNVDFYEVVRATPKTIWIRPIRSCVVETHSWASGTRMPIPGEYIGNEVMRRRNNSTGIRITSFSYAFAWNGQPVNYSCWY